LLIAHTDSAEAYRGRSLASLRLGNINRAKSDQELAARLDPKGAETFQKKVQEEMQAASAPAPVDKLEVQADALLQAARSGATDKELVEKALTLRKTMNSQRLRYDEGYQDRLRQLEEALRAKPGDPELSADLAVFLYQGLQVRGERVEPRGERLSYRYQSQSMFEQEFARAEKLCDEALQRNPKQVKALVVKAAACIQHSQWNDAEQYLRQAIASRDDAPEVLDLFASVLNFIASLKAANAANLRTQKWVGSDFLYDYYRRPTQAELDKADEYDRQIQQLMELAKSYIERAVARRAGTAEGFYYQAVLQKREGDLEGMSESFEKAVEKDPRYLRAWEELVKVYTAQNQTDKAMDAQLVATNLLETSAWPLLRSTWSQVPHTAFKSAREGLACAWKIDPTDVRIPAYLGIVALAEEKPDDALAYFRVAMALLEARARLSGTTYGPGGTGLRNREEFGMIFTLRLHAGELLLKRGKPAEALELFRVNLALQERMSPRELTENVYSAMLPDPSVDSTTIPEAQIMGAYVAWSRMFAGRALEAQGQNAEAVKELLATVTFTDGKEWMTCPGNKFLADPRAWATVELGRVYLNQGDLDNARKWIPPGRTDYKENAPEWRKEQALLQKRLQSMGR
jgi:tetratricopeptide (TPR) repeat protein